MFNIIKADLQRVFRGKGIWITLLIFLIFSFLSISSLLNTGDYSGGVDIGINMNIEGDMIPVIPLEIVGINTPLLMASNADTILFLILPLIVFVASVDFSSGAVKNTLSNGVNRSNYYVVKLITTCTLSIIIYALHIFIPTIAITIIRGFGGTFKELVNNSFGAFLGQLWLILALTCIGVSLTFITKKTALMNGLYTAFLIAPLFILMLLISINERFVSLVNYDFVVNFQAIASFPELPSEDIRRVFLLGLVYIVVSTASGIVLFRKAEIT